MNFTPIERSGVVIPQIDKIPFIGRIKVGEKTSSGHPCSLDYFRATGIYASEFTKQYGNTPRQLFVTFASNDVDEILSTKYILRDYAGKPFGKGDGVNFEIWNKEIKGYDRYDNQVYPNEIMDWAENEVRSEARQKNKKSNLSWEVEATLKFIIMDVPVYGNWVFTTKGVASTIGNLINTVSDVHIKSGGRLMGFPFTLTVEKVKSQKPGISSVFPVVMLTPNLSQTSLDKVALMQKNGQELQGLLSENSIQSHTLELKRNDVIQLESETSIHKAIQEIALTGILKDTLHVWNKYPQFHNDERFKKTANEVKKTIIEMERKNA